AQLIDAKSDRRVWSQDFNRELSDVYAVQQEIAQAIAGALELQLGDGLRASRPTLNSRAHDAYLLGLSQWHRRTRAGVAQSIAHFETAIREDSLYAKAWAGLALAHSIHPIYDFRVNSLESARLTLDAARRALALDSTLSEPHAAMGQAITRYEWKWKVGLDELRRAVELSPNDALTHSYLGSALVTQGNFAEGMEEADRAVDLDPLSVYVRNIRAVNLYVSGRKDEAFSEMRLVRSMSADVQAPLHYLGRTYLMTGQFDSAAVMLRRWAELDGFTRPEETRQFIDALRARRLEHAGTLVASWEKAGPFSAYQLAVYYNIVGDREAAIRMLTQAFNTREAGVVFLAVDPDMELLRSDPRVSSILRRMGLR
ncbi:MAG: tetratricopeptide repeat protein, partial [Longimicrobiales bacterium]